MPASPTASIADGIVRVLLLDDDPIGSMLTAGALRERGFDVVECDRADRALAELEHGGVDCVVADVLMPDVDGFEFCRRVRATAQGATLPILMLTSLDEDEATRQAYEAGASDYCIKTLNWTLLSHRIRQLLKLAKLEGDAPAARAAGAAATSGAFDWQPAARRVRGSTDLYRLLDWPDAPASLRDTRLLALVGAADRRALRRALGRLLSGGAAVRQEIEVLTRAGRPRRLRVDVHQVATTVGGAIEVAGLVHDVTPSHAHDAGIYRLTHHDVLTGLPNRTWFVERIRRAAAPGSPACEAVAVLDIDRFRHVGEALGQAASDRLLVEIGQRLRRLARTVGAGRDASTAAARIEAVAHLGADEFALLIGGAVDAESALAVARTAVATLGEPFRVDGRELFLRASAGVHVEAVGSDDPAQRLARAELARRAAAAIGGNAALAFEPSMAELGSDRLEMERDLHYALARGEMTMYYQPQVDAAHGRIVGFEALMRWARGGRLEPAGRFIPLAEETGLIVPLGEWAIGESCAALAALRERGFVGCTMSVNLSCQQLRTGRLPAVIAGALAEHRVPAERLEVELTESGMMRDPDVAVAQLGAVRALGTGLAVDDFGTGYSSLAYLTRLPLTTLKIDRSFVMDVHLSERSRAVAQAIVALGENLRLRVVAEGVETVEQRDALLALGCRIQQGWLFARAMPLADVLSSPAVQAAGVRGRSVETAS